jgi:hypothetical protein
MSEVGNPSYGARGRCTAPVSPVRVLRRVMTARIEAGTDPEGLVTAVDAEQWAVAMDTYVRGHDIYVGPRK